MFTNLCAQGLKFAITSVLFDVTLDPHYQTKKKHFTDHKWAGSDILAFMDQLPYTHSQTLVYLPNVPNVTMSSWRLLEQKFLLCSITSSQIWLIPLVLVHLTKLKKRIPAYLIGHSTNLFLNLYWPCLPRQGDFVSRFIIEL